MALRKIDPKVCSPEVTDGIVLNVNNGDLEALNNIKDKWNFKSEADVLRFALAVLKQADKQVVYIDQEGSKVGLTPSDDLVNKKND